MRRNYTLWSKEMDNYLINNTHKSAADLANDLHVTKTSIHNRVKKLGISISKNIPGYLYGNPYQIKQYLWLHKILPRLVENENGCMEWSHACDSHGYGQVRTREGIYLIHRIAYEVANNTILTTDKCVCHKCDNPKCCNPDHLFIGTHKDNVRDMWAKGRNSGQYKKGHKNSYASQARGSRSAMARFKEEDISVIRERHVVEGIGHKKLAKEYGVAYGTMRSILRRKTWRHV